ncbi:MAG: SulP family inorganic anion transporter, partial [bacterium]
MNISETQKVVEKRNLHFVPPALPFKNWFPFLRTIQTYDRSKFHSDLLAGLTIALVALPQSMAFAMIVGIEPKYGIYAVIVGSLIGALFGSSRHLHTGPTNTSSIVIAMA